jgi:hypothetical protein
MDSPAAEAETGSTGYKPSRRIGNTGGYIMLLGR